MRHATAIVALLLLPLLAGSLMAQRNSHWLNIPKPVSTPVYINDTIVGDTLAGAVRRDSARIYILERGGLYFLDAVIRNTTWPLTIKAADSAGPRPVVYLVKNRTTGTQPAGMFDIRGNFSVSNLVLTAILEADTSYFSVMNGQIMNTGAAGWNVSIDSCILTNTNGNHVRTDNAPKTVRITNSIFANMGYLGRSNLGAGKAIDLRAGSCDTLWVVNNTFVNNQDRIIRHFQSTLAIKFLRFDHNTIVNSMSYHGLLSLGRMGNKAIITNNLLVDPFALGNDTDFVRQAEFNESGELDAFGGRRMSWIFSVNNDSTQWTIRNNRYAISDSGQGFLTKWGLTEGQPLSWHINGKLGADSATAFVKLTGFALTKTPALMTRMMDWYRTPSAQGGAGKTKTTTNFRRLQHDYDRRTWQYFEDTLDCAYSTASPAYSAAIGGYPVGDLNWFPSRKAAWAADPTTDVVEQGFVPTELTLAQNYPNPFNPTTRIAFSLPSQLDVTLEVFDILGRKVATLAKGIHPAGTHEVDLDASRLTSGLYIYRLAGGSMSVTRKMMLVK